MKDKRNRFDYRLRKTGTGTEIHHGDEGLLHELEAWFDTPEGSIYGMPQWGHPNNKYQHAPPTQDQLILIKLDNYRSLQRDLPGLLIEGILVYESTSEQGVFDIAIKVVGAEAFIKNGIN